MIKRMSDISRHMAWLEDYLHDSAFSSPFCDRERILSVSGKADHVLLGAYQGERLAGIFCLMVLEDEKTIETIFLYCRDREPYEELMAYLSEHYGGYEVWFVFNPQNHVLKSCLSARNAFFYAEQRFMEYRGGTLSDTEEIIPYCAAYREEYIRIHNDEGYWNGEKVLERLDDFDVFLCVRDGRLVGYADLSKGAELVEIMDIWILPEYRNQGIGALLLRKAIVSVSGKRLILTVDVDNDAANHLYEKLGFREIAWNNCVTARLTVAPAAPPPCGD